MSESLKAYVSDVEAQLEGCGALLDWLNMAVENQYKNPGDRVFLELGEGWHQFLQGVIRKHIDLCRMTVDFYAREGLLDDEPGPTETA